MKLFLPLLFAFGSSLAMNSPRPSLKTKTYNISFYEVNPDTKSERVYHERLTVHSVEELRHYLELRKGGGVLSIKDITDTLKEAR